MSCLQVGTFGDLGPWSTAEMQYACLSSLLVWEGALLTGGIDGDLGPWSTAAVQYACLSSMLVWEGAL